MNRALISGLIVASIVFGMNLANAQTRQNSRELAGNTDWNKFVDAIKAAPSTSILEISGDFHTDENILKADKIVFADGSRLTFDRVDYPFLVIVAKEIIFSAPKYRATIERKKSIYAETAARGADAVGQPPKKPNAAHKNRGADGDPGFPGGTGALGVSIDLPDVFIATNEVSRQGGGTSGFIDLKLLFAGINGGQGGQGGNGGKGGAGGDGGKGIDHFFDCAGGPGDGGTGGPGGRGGRGGDGGRGGNGADIYYVGSNQALDELEVSRVWAPPGLPGRGGPPGNPGPGGDGGARGGRTTYCHGGSRGSIGPEPSPPDDGYGQDSSVEGQRGKIESVVFDVNTLF